MLCYPFSADLSLMCDRGGVKTFDVGISPTQIMPSQCAFNVGWEEHFYMFVYAIQLHCIMFILTKINDVSL